MKGTILRGSLSGGFDVRLAIGENIEEIKVGTFCVVEGKRYDFFSMVVDEEIEATNPQVLYDTFSDNPLIDEIVMGTGVIEKVKIQPMIMIDKLEGGVRPVKSIPSHMSPVRAAIDQDVFTIFGEPDEDHFHVGSPLDMEDIPLCVNLDRFIERSNGIFGKSGTGKTFYTRIMLCGMIKSQKANVLVFDVHNEYGWKGSSEDIGAEVKGLKQLFGSQVAIFTLDEKSSKNRGVRPDFVVEIPYRAIEPGDIALVWEELNLNPTALESIYILQRYLGSDWLLTFLKMDVQDIKDMTDEVNASQASLQALQRKLMALERLPFIKENPADDAVKRIMEYLDNGINVVLEFGRYQNNMLAYMLVANILTRRIHERYVTRSERAQAGQGEMNKPLVIVIEEAHKFLSPELSNQTIFGMIAREMRKNNVTLLVVDQRPSGIDPEVQSQLGTKIIALLTDERDIEAALSGSSNARMLRNVLASLETKRQAIILGHAVPMPVVIRTREYDFKFYEDMTDGLIDDDEDFTGKRFLDDMAEYLEDNGDVQVDVSDIDGIEELFKG